MQRMKAEAMRCSIDRAVQIYSGHSLSCFNEKKEINSLLFSLKNREWSKKNYIQSNVALLAIAAFDRLLFISR